MTNNVKKLVVPSHIERERMKRALEAAPVPPQRCGNCWYQAVHPDAALVFCTGVPPTPVILGLQRDEAGNNVPIVQGFWPVLPKVARRCAHWRHDEVAS